MTFHIQCLALGASGLLTISAIGQTPGDPPTRDPGAGRLKVREEAAAAGPMQRASLIIGTAIEDSSGTKIGKIQDFAVDLKSGRVIETVISVGGVLGVGGKTVAAPVKAVAVETGDRLTTTLDKASLEGAPAFDVSNWGQNFRPEALSQVDRYYKDQKKSHLEANIGYLRAAGDEPVASASKLIGMKVRNDQDETVGKVEDIIVQLTSSKVAEIVVSAGGFLGIGDELNGVPPSSFRYDPEKKTLTLSVSKDELAKAPRFKRDNWADATTGNNLADVYHYYHAKAYYDGSEAGEGARGATTTARDQGNNPADLDLTRSIRKDLRGQSGLSVSGRNVMVVTQNGHVTLKGTVISQDEKTKVQEIALRYAPAGSIDNQLEVKAETNR